MIIFHYRCDSIIRSIFQNLFIILQVLAFFNFAATGSFQTCVGNSSYVAICQPSIRRSIRNVTHVLCEPDIVNEWIKFPLNIDEIKQVEYRQVPFIYFLQ